jgi:hypothetical protein
VEIVFVGEIHPHGTEVHRGARPLRRKLDRHPLVGLNPQHEPVGIAGGRRDPSKHGERRRAKADGDLRLAGGQVFSGPEVERDAGPAPVVDLDTAGDVGLDIRISGDVRLAAVVAGRPAEHRASRVLPPHGFGHGLVVPQRTDRPQQVGLLVANLVSVERDRRLHGGHGEQLEHVVRNHVAQRAGLFVEPAAAFDAHRLGGRDLHVIDVVAVPDRLEEPVGKPQHHDVLDRLLAEEMIDAVDLPLVEHGANPRVERHRRRQVMTKRLFDDHVPPLPGRLAGQPRGAEMINDRPEKAVGNGQVEEPVAAGAGRLVEAGEMLVEAGIAAGIVEIALEIRHATDQPVPVDGIDAAGLKLAVSLDDTFLHHCQQAALPLGRSLGDEVAPHQPE